jgi:hypothetical protein
MDSEVMIRCTYQSPIPLAGASHVVTTDNLAQPPGANMSYLDVVRIEDEYVGWVPRDVLRSTLPLDRASFKIGLATPIHIQPEF